MKILAAALESCVHVAGLQSFLEIARSMGYETVFLGPAVPVKQIVAAIESHKPDIVALSYRLSPENAMCIFDDLRREMTSPSDVNKPRMFFGGTPSVVVVAKKAGVFDVFFEGGETRDAVVRALGGTAKIVPHRIPSRDLVSRIQSSYPVPLIRHHFGLPSLWETVEGARRIAESGSVDIISIAPDQNAQEFFFSQSEMDLRMNGAGGVPLRSPEDLKEIFRATRTGNHPLLRCYSGTTDLIKWAKMLHETIDVAWGAVPLTWYSELDNRSKRPLEQAIAENQQAIRWYAEQGVPVEVNESHQWALRRSGDVIEVAMAYIAAHNARALGVEHYVCQLMLDTPKGVSPAMDLAKMLAKLELVESFQGPRFKVYRMVRPGLESFSSLPFVAKGQLASSVHSAMSLKPHIVHVVGFSEAHHAATADEVIESCEIARGVISRTMLGDVAPKHDPKVQARKAEIISDAKYLIDTIKRLGGPGVKDPFSSPKVLAEAVREGILDASDLRGSKIARGRITTAIVDGACVTIDPASGKPISEKERIQALAVSGRDLDLAEM